MLIGLRKAILPLVGIIVVWAGLAAVYFYKTPVAKRNHDFSEHLLYTRILAEEGRFPGPKEGFETWQPPLYYLFAKLVPPKSLYHIRWVRIFSAICGGLSLIIIFWALKLLGAPNWQNFLILAMSATTQTFFQIFTTYNNDSLSVMLCIATVFAVMKCLSKQTAQKSFYWWLIFLFLANGASAYTKYTAFAVMGILCLIILVSISEHYWGRKKGGLVFGMLVLSTLLIYPWLHFHNFFHTGQFFPNNFGITDKTLTLVKMKDALIPRWLEASEWSSPFVNSKKDYYAYLFSSSLFGVYRPDWGFYRTSPMWSLWSLYWVRLLIAIFSVFFGFFKKTGRLSLLIIFLASILHLVFLRAHPQVLFMQFRYVAWTWLLWSILNFHFLDYGSKSVRLMIKIPIISLFLVGIFLQLHFLFSLS